MIPAEFDYKRAGTLAEALAALHSEDVKILAGGQSLIPSLKLRLNRPTMLVDIGRLAELKGIREEDGEIVIGAATTHHELETDSLIKSKLPFFPETASHIADPSIRNMGTIGGNLAHADPAADWPASILAAGAVIEVQGKKGKRRIPSDDFFKGLFMTDLKEDEIILAVRVPTPPEGTRTKYLRFSQPASRYAMVGCAVMRTPDNQFRIAFTGVSSQAFRDKKAEEILNGKDPNNETIARAAMAALDGRNMLQDQYASSAFREHLARVYLKKALMDVC